MINHHFYLGTAGWALTRGRQEHFPPEGTHLEKYARRFNAVEINSSFYRPHQLKTYIKWANSVDENFRFAVKLPRTITHIKRLVDTSSELHNFLAEIAGLGDKLGCILVQLPPSLQFDNAFSATFLQMLRQHYSGHIVLEPRHISWFASPVATLLQELQIARVAADPSPIPQGNQPAGWDGIIYYRLHGSPKIYHSAYSTEYLKNLADQLIKHINQKTEVWCIFDNTASDAAMGNAFELDKIFNTRT